MIKSSFVNSVAATFVAKIGGAVIGLISSVVITRMLGPDGRGVFITAMTLVSIGMQFANLGLHSSNSYYLSRDSSLLNAIVANSVLLALGLGFFVGGGLVIIVNASSMAVTLNSGILSYLFLSIPAGLAYMLTINLLVVIDKVALFNYIEIGVKLIILIFVLIVSSVLGPTPDLFMQTALIAQLIGFLLISRVLNFDFSKLRNASVKLIFEQIPFAFRSYIASLLGFLMLRSDILMVQSMSGNKEVGYYSVGVAIVDMIYFIPASIGLILFPKLAKMPDPMMRRRLVWRAFFFTGGILIFTSLSIYICATFIVETMYGYAFLPTVPMLNILLLAIIFYGLSSILTCQLLANGLPWSSIWIWLLGFLMNVGLNFVLVPSWGGEGAAIASVFAYLFVLIAQVVWVRRSSGVRF